MDCGPSSSAPLISENRDDEHSTLVEKPGVASEQLVGTGVIVDRLRENDGVKNLFEFEFLHVGHQVAHTFVREDPRTANRDVGDVHADQTPVVARREAPLKQRLATPDLKQATGGRVPAQQGDARIKPRVFDRCLEAVPPSDAILVIPPLRPIAENFPPKPRANGLEE